MLIAQNRLSGKFLKQKLKKIWENQVEYGQKMFNVCAVLNKQPKFCCLSKKWLKLWQRYKEKHVIICFYLRL